MLSGDLPRRALRCVIDPQVDEPEKREFPYDPVEQARCYRGKLVVALLTMWRAYFLAGCPQPKRFLPTGSFEAWDIVRKILIWLDEPDPANTVALIRKDDPKRINLNGVLTQWELTLGSEPHTSAQIIARAVFGVDGAKSSAGLFDDGAVANWKPVPEFREALLAACGKNGAIDTNRLGSYLGKNKGKVVGGRRVVEAGELHGNMRWRVERAPSEEVAEER